MYRPVTAAGVFAALCLLVGCSPQPLPPSAGPPPLFAAAPGALHQAIGQTRRPSQRSCVARHGVPQQ